jgi:hypothetical protein
MGTFKFSTKTFSTTEGDKESSRCVYSFLFKDSNMSTNGQIKSIVYLRTPLFQGIGMNLVK